VGKLIDRDAEHLRLLGIFYYVHAAFSALLSCFALIYVVIGAVFLANPDLLGAGANGPPAILGCVFTILGAVLLLLGLGFSACLALVGRFLCLRRGRAFCLVVAALNCLFFPYGTVLGVLTFMVLTRPSVQALFQTAPPPLPPSAPA
jgi:hypothetical protein